MSWTELEMKEIRWAEDRRIIPNAPQPTPDHIKAMQMALEALNSFDPYDDFACLWKQTADADIDSAITALQNALRESSDSLSLKGTT